MREPLDSIEYESTYLELRPERERLGDASDAAVLAPRRPDGRVYDAVALYGIAAVDTQITVLEIHTARPLPADGHLTAGPAHADAVHPFGAPARPPRLSTSSWRRTLPSMLCPRRLRSWTPRQVSLLALSASLGLIAALDARAAHALFVALTGILILGWARLAWRGTPRAKPFGRAATRLVDRSVTALGTFFAIALWTRYAPQASTGFARTGVLVLCGVGLMPVLLARSRPLPS